MSEEKQPDMFQADTTWFHVFREMVKSGQLAKMEGSTVKVYLAVKARTTWEDGRAFPSIDQLVVDSGLSDKQVRRCLKDLEDLGYIKVEKHGRRNTYELREQLQLKDPATGEEAAMASFKYIPMALKKATDEIRQVILKDPNIAVGQREGGVIHIDRINIQIIQQIGNNNVQNNAQNGQPPKPDLSTKPE